jgi:transposase
MSEEKSVYVGIDVAKKTLEVATSPEGLRLSLPNTPQGHRKLVAELKKLDVAKVVMEASGGYERTLSADLLDAGYDAVVEDPRRIRHFAKGMGKVAKTDRIDAAVIARYAEVVRPERSKIKADADLAALVGRRSQLVDMIRDEKNRLDTAGQRAVQKSLREGITWMKRQVAKLEREIAARIKADDDMSRKDKILQSVPGIKDKTSAMLLSRLPELGTLNRQEVAALVGVAPYDAQSGQWRGKSRIWGGRADVRRALYMPALAARRCNEKIRRFAQRLEKAGKPHKVILVACMRKLLVILNTMLRTNTTWQSA